MPWAQIFLPVSQDSLLPDAEMAGAVTTDMLSHKANRGHAQVRLHTSQSEPLRCAPLPGKTYGGDQEVVGTWLRISLMAWAVMVAGQLQSCMKEEAAVLPGGFQLCVGSVETSHKTAECTI